jgi:hypothetical protein
MSASVMAIKKLDTPCWTPLPQGIARGRAVPLHDPDA